MAGSCHPTLSMCCVTEEKMFPVLLGTEATHPPAMDMYGGRKRQSEN